MAELELSGFGVEHVDVGGKSYHQSHYMLLSGPGCFHSFVPDVRLVSVPN